MSLIKPKRIEDYLIFYLKKGSTRCLDLVMKIQEIRPGTTKQAVYSALRLLRDEEQIIIAKGLASLNLSWINEMTTFFELTKDNYLADSGSGSFLDLEDNERIKYYFNNTHKADIFWTHAYYLLIEQLKSGEPIFLYNPHEWFLLARTANEISVYNTAIKKNHPVLVTAGNNTFLDKYVLKYFDGTMRQCNTLSKPIFKENNYYINIFGDFLLEAWLDKDIANKIEDLYKTTNDYDDVTKEAFQNILEIEGRMRIVISRNHKKTLRLKKSLAKGFAIKKEQRP
ncbi:MAG: hypothetical protein US25_C0072G0008 [Candidatus Moranbacteria bacterium GW2011_GWE1_36_7]|nr:MAG: hypothetical protein UR99_C0045G0007 [Candidatus Moranbacteria bacterium GW2011_GWD2_36_12]KKQ11808.1 MAG: hypothetical protein US25_C0072G0008 [Candidatus Moranbacteria bacterium GW2011_GWE1_36_7]